MTSLQALRIYPHLTTNLNPGSTLVSERDWGRVRMMLAATQVKALNGNMMTYAKLQSFQASFDVWAIGTLSTATFELVF